MARRSLLAATPLLALSLAWGVLALGHAGGAHAYRAAADGEPLVEATHLPPLLTTNADKLDSLRYDVSCATPGSDADQSCDLDGVVYVRPGQTGPFTPVALQLDPTAPSSRYVAKLPAAVSGSPSGFSYYAVIRDRRSGASTTLPAGGGAAPQRSLQLSRPVTVDLGSHRFGTTQTASTRVASAAWGDGPTNVGLEDGPQLDPIGASSFAVDAAGNVSVLDEAHRRLLRFDSLGTHARASVPVDIRGTIADLAVGSDGTSYVLESVADPGTTPVVRGFDSAGHVTGSWHAAQPSASALHVDGGGLQALEYPAGQWMPISTTGSADSAANQWSHGRSGRMTAGGSEIVSQREGDEARIALVSAKGVLRSWRIRSATPLAEIQLVEPLGKGFVAVIRTYTDTSAEYVALVLGPRGLVRQLSIPASDWAETEPLARFRLVGSSLFHLGSTRSEMFVDRYDLEVPA